MKAWLIGRRVESIARIRRQLGDDVSPVEQIQKPKYMRTVEFNNKTRNLRYLEADLERLLFEALK